MLYFILFIEWTILIGTSGFNLDCTHHYAATTMSCSSAPQNCTGLRMTLTSDKSRKKMCAFQSCVKGCCCQMTQMIGDDKVGLLTAGNTFMANVYEDGQRVHSQTISVYETLKPNSPKIISVSKSNTFYKIKWRSNNERAVREELRAVLTYHKKGEDLKRRHPVSLSTIEDMSSFELPADLEPSTTYVISVSTYTWFNVSSDSSKEVEVTTDPSLNGAFLAVILSLCVAAVIVSALSFVCFVHFKGKLWDKAVKLEEPKLLDIKPNKKEVLEPESLNVHVLRVEPLVSKDSMTWSKESLTDSSGEPAPTSILSSVSFVDYNNIESVDSEECVLRQLMESFPMFTPNTNWVLLPSEEPKQRIEIAPTFTSPLAFDNECYEAPSCAAVGWQETCDSGYQSSDGPRLQDFMTPFHLAPIETDMSYQPCMRPSDCQVSPVVYSYQEFEKLIQPDDVSLEPSSDSQLIPGLPGLSNINPDIDLFRVTQISKEIIVDSGYHSV